MLPGNYAVFNELLKILPGNAGI